MTRQLKGPRLFGACLPFGPAVKPPAPPMRLQAGQEKEGEDDRPIEELAVDYKGWLNLMELELIAVAGLEGKQADSHKGRGEGPKYGWVDQSKCEAAGPARTTSVSRAWRRTAGWLADALHAKKAAKAEAARWKVLFYKHPQPNPAFATPEQLKSMARFTAWRAAVTEANTFSTTWLSIFKDMAVKQAEQKEEAARVAATIKFAD